MTIKQSLMHNIAETAYDIGFGGKKHFKTYDMYRIIPKTVSVLTIIVGVIQLLDVYKRIVTSDVQDVISTILIIIGLVALVIDLNGESKNEYERVGKIMLVNFNNLRRMYYEVESMDESSDFKPFQIELEEIILKSNISLSKQAIFTHWSTHFGFFKGMQSRWVIKELNLTWKDKYPIWHWETIVYLILVVTFIRIVYNFFI